ncbi:hypothetical protein Tco_0525823 [Tanacetum coccineum]
MGRDQAKMKRRRATSSTSSGVAVGLEALTRLMVNKYAMVNESYNVQQGQDRTKLLEIKKMELTLKNRKLKIREIDQRRKYEAINLSTSDEKLKREASRSIRQQDERMTERWFSGSKRRPQSAPVRRVEPLTVNGARRRGRPKLRWEDRLKTDLGDMC